MKFKPTNKTDSSSGGCFSISLFFIGIVAFGYFLLHADANDFTWDRILMIIFIVGSIITFIAGIFKKKAANIQSSIAIEGEKLYMRKIDPIPLDQLHLDIYKDDKKFYRYHLWDDKGKLALYSAYKDDLVTELQNFNLDVNHFYEESGVLDDGLVQVNCKNGYSFYYNLENGAYQFINREGHEKAVEPEYIMVDPKYKIYSDVKTSRKR